MKKIRTDDRHRMPWKIENQSLILEINYMGRKRKQFKRCAQILY